MPTAIALACTTCGHETDNQQAQEGRCIECRMRSATEPLRDPLIVALKKRQRYERRGLLARHNDETGERATQRFVAACQEINHGAQAQALIEKLLTEIRVEAEGGASGRLMVPRRGELRLLTTEKGILLPR